MRLTTALAALTVVLATTGAWAEITISGVAPGAEGSDGALNYSGSTYPRFDLSKATTGNWAQVSDGNGIYDPEKWAVVFKYTSVNLNMNSGYNFAFSPVHPSGAPVVWLVWGNVNINYLTLNGGSDGGSQNFTSPGPGGFRGGRGGIGSTPASGGFGPGGGHLQIGISRSAGSYGTSGATGLPVTAAPTYGNPFILPLLGGSGGSAYSSQGGGAGGGAITIIATGTITINDNGLRAQGGSGHGNLTGGGSGGAIRLIADRVQGDGYILAQPGGGLYAGGKGRVFVQANVNTLTRESDPPMLRTNFIDSPFYIWPPESGDPVPPEHIAPKVWPVKMVANGGDVPFPADPRASLDFQLTDVAFDTTNSVDLHISATNMPTDWTVVARIVLKAGDSFTTPPATLVSGDQTASNWVVSGLDLPRGIGAIQVRAFKPAQP